MSERKEIEETLERIERLLHALLLEAELERKQLAKILAALTPKYPAPTAMWVEVM